MHRRAFIAAIPPLALTPAAAALAHPPQAPLGAEAQRMIDEVTAFRARLAKAIETRNLTILRASYADAFTHTDGSGKLDNKDARLAAAMAGEPLIEAAPATDLSFRVFTGPTVIVTGKSPMPNAKEQKAAEFRWLAVYVTALSGWQLAVSQATRLA